MENTRHDRWAECLIANDSLMRIVCSYMPTQDLLVIRKVNRSLRKLALTALLQRSLSEHTFEAVEWEMLIRYSSVCIRQPDVFQRNSLNNDEESEHSRDLDRTFLTEETEHV
jgi:hypothetical protein